MAAGSATRSRTPLSRQRIVTAALTGVEARGYTELSLRSLARDLGVTAPAIYDHFDGKADVLQTVAAEGYRAMDAAFVVDGARAIDRCRQRALAYVAFAQDRPELFRVMFLYRPAAVAMDSDNELPAANDTFETGLADIALAIVDGDLVERDPVQINFTLWAAIHGVATIGLMAPALADLVVDDVVDAMFRGLRPDGS